MQPFRPMPGRMLTGGEAEGAVLWADTGLSFWGGVDPASGRVIDQHHPLRGESLAGRILAVPSGRGSCSGSGVLLELILSGLAPAGIVVRDQEEILTLGALVGELMFGRALPILQIGPECFRALVSVPHARIRAGRLEAFPEPSADPWCPGPPCPDGANERPIELDADDRAMLSGRDGGAVQMAMRLLLRMAALQGAARLLDVTRVHIDGCVYTGPASLRFAQVMADKGGRVRVPTTLNAISVDRGRWRAQRVPATFGEPAAALADTYVAMGAQPTFTCAPYLLDGAPERGEQIGWAESNAVVFANSVLGARTTKYPDFLDLCIALTGRAPEARCHTDAGRLATLAIDVAPSEGADDAMWPLLGYACGLLSGGDIPLVRGLEASGPSRDDLKAFGAAFATTASAPMFHIAGVTPEAAGQDPSRSLNLGRDALHRAWDELNTADAAEVDLVCLGNPHFSLSECARLAALVRGRHRSPASAVTVTCGRAIHDQAAEAGHVATAEAFGVNFVTDTCWCMLGEPVVPPTARTLMTNSAKYAHYAPGLVGRRVRFGSLAECVEAAVTGRSPRIVPAWLLPPR